MQNALANALLCTQTSTLKHSCVPTWFSANVGGNNGDESASPRVRQEIDQGGVKHKGSTQRLPCTIEYKCM